MPFRQQLDGHSGIIASLVWFRLRRVRSGRKIHEQIDEAIRLHDKLLLILSPNSMQSEWVKTEISKARKRELRNKSRVLF
ncbi:MAG TPA: toll/interleukin-1 receptor domain-containing protein, partial [Candidatus Acidoferrum sp.]|nr:toll/interleukin-1 receptor domain-containing protein [Candidatus Acidoferrum sp.]